MSFSIQIYPNLWLTTIDHLVGILERGVCAASVLKISSLEVLSEFMNKAWGDYNSIHFPFHPGFASFMQTKTVSLVLNPSSPHLKLV